MINLKTISKKFKDCNDKTCKKIKFNKITILAFLLSFMLMLTFIDITLRRNAAIRAIKAELSTAITKLNVIGLDIAYDKIEFDNVFIYPLMVIKNLRLYNLKGQSLWEIKINQLSARPKFLANGKIKIFSEDGAEFKYDDKFFKIL